MKNASKNRRLDRVPREYRDAVKQDVAAIAQKIRKRRRAMQLTQEQLAESLNIEPSTLQSLEQQRGRPSLELLLTIAKVLQTKFVIK